MNAIENQILDKHYFQFMQAEAVLVRGQIAFMLYYFGEYLFLRDDDLLMIYINYIRRSISVENSNRINLIQSCICLGELLTNDHV